MEARFIFSRAFSTRVESTQNVRDCAAMFGIGIDEDIEISLYEDLPLTIGSGRIIYLTGESGAGKSCLLGDIMAEVGCHEEMILITDADIGELPPKPLVDQFGDWPIRRIGELLSFVGISEAFIYLRKPAELSDGQRYRFALARLIWEAELSASARQPVICIDEFLAFLDRETARNVAYQVRRVATKFGLCFCVATTHGDIAKDLQANTTVTLRLNVKPTVERTALAGA